MAREVGDLEDSEVAARQNGVALFDREFTFGWDELLSKVIGEYRHIADYFSGNEERGMAFCLQAAQTTRRTTIESPRPDGCTSSRAAIT